MNTKLEWFLSVTELSKLRYYGDLSPKEVAAITILRCETDGDFCDEMFNSEDERLKAIEILKELFETPRAT